MGLALKFLKNHEFNTKEKLGSLVSICESSWIFGDSFTNVLWYFLLLLSTHKFRSGNDSRILSNETSPKHNIFGEQCEHNKPKQNILPVANNRCILRFCFNLCYSIIKHEKLLSMAQKRNRQNVIHILMQIRKKFENGLRCRVAIQASVC